MSVTIDIIDQDVFASLVTFFKTFIPSNVEIIQAQENLVAMPKGGFIAMNNTGMETVALFRDEYTTDLFPANIQPLYADDPVQLPLIDGEQQYEQRWKLEATLQYNPILTTSQQSMLDVIVELAPIDQTFNP